MSLQYRSDIDGLRALAILSVVLYHLDFQVVGGGYIGVDLFFVISGYLITGSSLQNLSGLGDIGDFYRRRAARILPMALLTVVGVVVASMFIYDVFERKVLLGPAQPAALFYSNIYFWRTHDYFNIMAEINPFLHTWTLSIEEQFYLVIPFMMFFVRHSVMLLWTVTAVSFVTMLLAPPQAAFYLLPARMWEFCAGALLVYTKPPSPRLGAIASMAGLALFGLGLAVSKPSLETSSLLRLLPVLAGVLTIWGGNARNPVSDRYIGWRPMAVIGRFSYSTYLVHWPVWVFVASTMEPGPGARAALAIAIFAGSWGLYQFIERPAQRLLRGLSLRGVGIASVGAITSCVAVVWAVQHDALAFEPRSASSASAAPVRQLVRVTDSSLYFEPYQSGVCFLRENQSPAKYQDETCIPPRNGRKRVLLWGDSTAAHLMHGLRKEANARGFDVYQVSAASCPPLATGDLGKRCATFNQWALETFIPREKPDLLVLTARWGRDFNQMGGPKLAQHLEETLHRVGAYRTLVLGQSPNFFKAVPLVLAGMLSDGESDLSRQALPAKSFDELNDLLRATSAKSLASFYDSHPAFDCGDEGCLAAIDGHPLFWDTGHMTKEGSDHAAVPLAAALGTALADRQALTGQ